MRDGRQGSSIGEECLNGDVQPAGGVISIVTPPSTLSPEESVSWGRVGCPLVDETYLLGGVAAVVLGCSGPAERHAPTFGK